MSSERLAFGALTASVTVSFGSLLYAFSILVTDRAAGGDFSTTTLSFAYGGTVLVGGGIAFYIGNVVDRHGLRWVLAGGSLLGALGLAGLGAARADWQIIVVAWALIGPAGAMTFYEPAFVAVDQWFPAERRGRAIGVLTVIGGLAGPIFLPLTAALVEGLGWRPTATILGVGVGVVGGVAATLVPPPTSRSAPATPQVRLGQLLRDRRFVWYTAGLLLLYGSFQTVLFHRIARFEEIGLAVGMVAFWAGISGWFSFPGRYFGPILGARRNGVRWNAALALALAATVSLIIQPGGRTAMIVHLLGFGLIFGAVLPMRAVVMARWYSGPRFGRVMGIQWTMAAVTGAAMPYATGWWRDTAGSYRSPMAAVTVAFVVAGLLTYVADRAERKNPVTA